MAVESVDYIPPPRPASRLSACGLHERNSGEYFVIDSSLVDTGELPPILPLAVWLGDWPPKSVEWSAQDARAPTSVDGDANVNSLQ